MRRGPLLISILLTVLVSFGALAAVLLAGWSPLLGLDLQGGVSVVFQPAKPVDQSTLQETISIIRNRVDALGVAQPNIGAQGNNIVVQLPGVKNQQQALQIIGQTAQLEFRPVLCSVALGPTAAKGQPAPELTGPPPSCDSSTNFADVPSTPASLDTSNATVLLPQIDPISQQLTGRFVMGPSQLAGSAVRTATAQLVNGQWEVELSFTSSGGTAFDKLASQQFHQEVAIVLDGVVQSAPEIQPDNTSFQSFGGQASITGDFDQAHADSLALVLRYGALPVQLDRQTVETVSPTLGKAALKAGIYSGLGGLALVMLYTIFYYRGLGLVVVLGLTTTACLLYAIISALSQADGLALDLSGCTGLIVSVGVTVDSYVVFFERLKDEVRGGGSIRTSVARSFTRAFRTIVAADLVSLIGAAVLYWLSVGDVRGFAFFLGLSTLLDVMTAWVFTRPLVILLGRSRAFTEAPVLGVARGMVSESELVA